MKAVKQPYNFSNETSIPLWRNIPNAITTEHNFYYMRKNRQLFLSFSMFQHILLKILSIDRLSYKNIFHRSIAKKEKEFVYSASMFSP